MTESGMEGYQICSYQNTFMFNAQIKAHVNIYKS